MNSSSGLHRCVAASTDRSADGLKIRIDSVADPLKVLTEVWRMLQPGGQLRVYETAHLGHPRDQSYGHASWEVSLPPTASCTDDRAGHRRLMHGIESALIGRRVRPDGLVGRTPPDAPTVVRPLRGHEANMNTSSETTPCTKIEIYDLEKDTVAGRRVGRVGLEPTT